MSAALPDRPTPADVLVGYICLVGESVGYEALWGIHRAPCRFCSVDRDALSEWLGVHEYGIATPADRFTDAPDRGLPTLYEPKVDR